MTPILLNPFGVFPDVTIPADGRPVVAFRISGGNLLRVMFLDPAGQLTGAQEDIDCAMGDSTFARLIVALGRAWLAYRAFRAGLEQAVVREVLPLSLGSERVLGPTFGNNPVCLSADGLVAWQDPTAGVVRGLRLSDGEALILRFEMRPTGLSHLDGDQPVFADDNRPTESAMWNPVRSGAVTVGEGRGQAEGLVAKVEVAPNDIRTGIVLPGSCLNPRCADFGESTYAAVSWTPGVGVQFLKFTPNDITAAAPAPPKPKPIPIDQIEPLVGTWLMCWYEQNGNVPDGKLPPGNAMVAVRNQSGLQPRSIILTDNTVGKVTGTIIGYRVGSEAQVIGEHVTIEIMEQRARTIAAKGYRPWFYWDAPIDTVNHVVLHTIPRWPVLPKDSVIEVNGFCGRAEAIPDWEREMWRYLSEAAALPGQYWLAVSAQSHTTNLELHVEPSVMIPPMVRLCKRARAVFGERFLGPSIFCNSGRDDPNTGEGGLTANPQLVPHWTKVYSGVTGLPSFGVVTPPVDPPPVDPPPVEQPIEPPVDPPPPARVRPYDDGTCATAQPGPKWTCDNGGWYPPDMPIPIGPPPPVDPPVDPVEPPMMLPPKITITEPTFPVSGTAQLKVRCVYAADPGSGPVSFIEWWHRGSDHVTRTIVNPGSDPDHTFTFPTAGTYEIGAVGVNAAGRHATGKKREVVVTAVHVPPSDPPVTEPTPGAGVTLKTASGHYLVVGADKTLKADAADDASASRFIFEKHDDNTAIVVAGKYLRADHGKGPAVKADRDAPGPDELFTLEPGENGTGVAFRTRTGTVFNAVNGGGGKLQAVSKPAIQSHETFLPSKPLLSGGGGGGPIPPASGDLTSWPRRGATIGQSLLDTRYDYDAWAQALGDIFGGRGLTQVNVLSAEWPDNAPHFKRPFVQLSDGRFDLRQRNQTFYDRLARYVETMNRHGVFVQLCFLELYSWSMRKTGLPFDQNLSPFRHNVNGVRWGGPSREEDDATLITLPDDFLSELVERVVDTVKGAGVAILPGNEFPEKSVHWGIAAIAKRVDPSIQVVVNRNEDTPGQYANMQVGGSLVDRIAFHGWSRLDFLDVDFPDEPPDRPRTFRQFFDKRAQNGSALDVDFSRVICSSDGSRSSNDPVNTYDWPRLLDVFRFVAGKGGSVEHQSRVKMTPGARLDLLETDFLKDIANL